MIYFIVHNSKAMGSQLSTIFKDEDQISHSTTIEKETILGDHETHLSDGSEGELHTRNTVCEKNPGHTKFIPVDKLTLEHLPEGQRDNDLYEYIKAESDLTVKVNVKMVSPHRPKFWPKTHKSYPFYDMGGQKDLRTGSGMMCVVYNYVDGVRQNVHRARKDSTKCCCKNCEHSDSPSNVWWEFDVITATHVVFDDIEASNTTMRLFYDNKDSQVVIVDMVSFSYVNIEDDMCRLKCVTCDKNLGDNLVKMWKRYLDARRKVWNKYQNSKSVNKLTFIVSHPHGCTKQISIGHWIKEYKLGKYKSKLAYKTCTCPGSSGAIVHYVGYKEWKWYPGHVHSGTNFEHKYNYSGVSW